MGDYDIVKNVFEVEGKVGGFKLKRKLHITKKRYVSAPRVFPLMRKAQARFSAKAAPYHYSTEKPKPATDHTPAQGNYICL